MKAHYVTVEIMDFLVVVKNTAFVLYLYQDMAQNCMKPRSLDLFHTFDADFRQLKSKAQSAYFKKRIILRGGGQDLVKLSTICPKSTFSIKT